MIDTILTEIAAKYGLKRRGNSRRYVGPCPKCGGSSGSDKFVIKHDGGFKCYACDFKGDIITWLRQMDGMSCPEAHEAAGQDCRVYNCQVRGTCRCGDGSGKRPAKVGRSVEPQPQEKAASLPVSEGRTPQQVWQHWALAMVDMSASRLQQQPEVLSWLAARGIDAAAVIRFRLGWLNHQQNVSRFPIGLDRIKNGKSTVWIPDGLVIPTFAASGEIHRLRIRRPDASRAKFLPDLKYVFIEGSGTMPLVIRSEAGQGGGRGTVIVEAELDAMAVAAAHDQITAIAIGTVSAGLPSHLNEEMEKTATILVTLDADPGKNGKPGPGPAAVKRWLDRWRQARFWPVPQGKDPGDYAKTGRPLRPWIESGLIPEIKPTITHDHAFIPGSSSTGGKGEESSSIPAVFKNDNEKNNNEDLPEPAAVAGNDVVYRIITLIDGRELHVTNNKPLWERLTAEGKIAFSENELKRLQLACGAMTEKERTIMALLSVDIKETFAGAYIKRGELVA